MPEAILTMDFGTTNSLVGSVSANKVIPALKLDANSNEPEIIKTLLFFPDSSQCFYGSEAVKMYEEHAFEGRFIKSIKKHLPSEKFTGSWIDNRLVRIEDLVSYFILELKKRAEKQTGLSYKSIVLGRPAKYSHDSAKDNIALYRMKKAAEMAGFEHIDFLPEPIAAAYDLKSKLSEDKTILVVDLGGGTSDFTIVNIGPKEFKRTDTLAVHGIPTAGDKFDGSIMQHKVAQHFGADVKYNVPLSSNTLEMPPSLLNHICSPADLSQLSKKSFYQFFQNLKSWNVSAKDRILLNNLDVVIEDNLGFKVFDQIEKSKIEINTNDRSVFQFDYADINISQPISHSEFVDFSRKQKDEIMQALDETFKLAQLKHKDIDVVYCTGGTSKLKTIKQGLNCRFTPEQIHQGSDFQSVIYGLTEYAKQL